VLEGPGAQLASLYDPEFVAYVREFEERMRARIMELYAQPRGAPLVYPPGARQVVSLVWALEGERGDTLRGAQWQW